MAQRPAGVIAQASDLDDETIAQLARGIVEQWGPQVKFNLVGLAVALAMLFLGQRLLPLPGMFEILYILPTVLFTPYVLRTVKQVQRDEAAAVGIDDALFDLLWTRLKNLGWGLRSKRDIELVRKQLIAARDELAANEPSPQG